MHHWIHDEGALLLDVGFLMPETINYGMSHTHTHTHTHTRLTAICPGLPGSAGTRKVKPIWILQKLETVSGIGISWVICKSASRSRQITMPAPHNSVFLQVGCPSCRPTNSVKALNASMLKNYNAPYECDFITCMLLKDVY